MRSSTYYSLQGASQFSS